MNQNALKPGALDRKTKLLMCVAIGIADASEYCTAARAAQAKEAGATRADLLETAAVGLMMGGSLSFGPILTVFMQTLDMLFPDSADECAG